MIIRFPSWLRIKLKIPALAWLGVQLANGWVWAQNRWRRFRKRSVDFVYLELTGYLPITSDTPSLVERMLGVRPTTGFGEVQEQLRLLAADPQVRGVVLVLRDFSPGWSMAENLRAEMHALRAAGKQVVVYLNGASTRLYYLACAADMILMPPSASLWITGLRLELLFVRDALQMLGVEAEVAAVSPYKSAGDSFTRSEISPEAREQSERLLEQRFAHLVAGIAADRQLAPEQVRDLIDGAPYFAAQALELGLVDRLCYADEIEAVLAEQHADSARPFKLESWQAAQRALNLPYRRHQTRYVAVIPIEGTLVEGEPRSSPLPFPSPLDDGGQVGSESVLRALRSVERDNELVAAVLYIDSPGGDAFASDLIWRDVLRLAQKKPVIACLGNVAASGGYYIAVAANRIVAHPTTITGSIGVLSVRPNAHGLYERLGVNTTVLQRGARADLLNIATPPSEDERQVIHTGIHYTYEQFKQRVCTGRKLTPETLEPLAGGRVWTGSEAHQHALVDSLGGLPEAVKQACALAQLDEAPPDAWVWVRPTSRRSETGLPPAFPAPTPAPQPLLHTLQALLSVLELSQQQLARPLLILPWLIREHD